MTSPSGRRSTGPNGPGFDHQRCLFLRRAGFARRGLHGLESGGATTFQERRQSRAKLLCRRTLDAHEADAERFQLGDEMGDRRIAQLDRSEIKHRGPAEKETGRTAHRFFELCEPVNDRRLRCQHEGQIRATAKTQLRACVSDVRQDEPLTILPSARSCTYALMVNEWLMSTRRRFCVRRALRTANKGGCNSLLTSKQRADRGGSVAAVRQVARDAMLDQSAQRKKARRRFSGRT